MYKDQQKQREAIRKAVQKHRKGITSGITDTVTSETKVLQGITPKVLQKDKGITSILGDTLVRLSGSRVLPTPTQQDIDNLPQHIRESIDQVCTTRARLGLFNDREDRLYSATQYHLTYPTR